MLCPSPIFKKSGRDRFFFPCGKCAACIQRYTNDLVIRASVAYANHSYCGHFITLTYNDWSIPDNGDVNKKDIQDFFKRLRITLQRHYKYKNKISYLLVSEYGTLYNRPHYHAVVFGLKNYYRDSRNRLVPLHYIMLNSWANGFVDCDSLRHLGGCRYILKYITKNKIERLEYGENYDCGKKNFLLMSKDFGKPTKNQIKYFRGKYNRLLNYYRYHRLPSLDVVDYTVELTGSNYAIPRYYKLKSLHKPEREFVTSITLKYIAIVDKNILDYQYRKLYNRLLKKRLALK